MVKKNQKNVRGISCTIPVTFSRLEITPKQKVTKKVALNKGELLAALSAFLWRPPSAYDN